MLTTKVTQKELLKYHKKVTEKMYEICKSKNHDYAGSDDAFFNFNRVEILGIANTEQGFLTRMLDKFCRIANFIKCGIIKVKDEEIEDTLLDLANYCILLSCYLRKNKHGNKK